jgi:hypothetical protein
MIATAADPALAREPTCASYNRALVERLRVDPELGLGTDQLARIQRIANGLCTGRQGVEAEGQAKAPEEGQRSLRDLLTRTKPETAGHKRLKRLKR